jgi:Rieske Fe-S protein
MPQHQQKGEHRLSLGRRVFLRLLLGLSGVLVLLRFVPYGDYLSFKPEVSVKKRIANLTEILPGSAMYFSGGPTGGGILVRDYAGNLHAFDPVCTHAGCQVVYDADDGLLRCPCHGSCFDLATGEAVVGPAGEPLTGIKLEIDKDDDIYAVGLVGED